jgi:hypothetical protein
MWWYKVTYYGGNQTHVRARGIEEAVTKASQSGRVVKIEEEYDRAC